MESIINRAIVFGFIRFFFIDAAKARYWGAPLGP